MYGMDIIIVSMYRAHLQTTHSSKGHPQSIPLVAKQKLQCATLQLCILISKQIDGNSYTEQQK